MLAMRQILLGPRGAAPALPYDYAVEYIETDGNGSYIDTGVVPEVKSIAAVKFAIQTLTNNAGLFGTRFGTGNYFNLGAFVAITSSHNRITFGFPSLASASPIQPADTNVHDVVLQSGKAIIDGVEYTTPATGATRIPVSGYMLGITGDPSYTSNHVFSNSRFYFCKIYTGGELVFDGIPVRKDGEGYLYDRVSQRLCGNAGASGTRITYGPDKS